VGVNAICTSARIRRERARTPHRQSSHIARTRARIITPSIVVACRPHRRSHRSANAATISQFPTVGHDDVAHHRIIIIIFDDDDDDRPTPTPPRPERIAYALFVCFTIADIARAHRSLARRFARSMSRR